MNGHPINAAPINGTSQRAEIEILATAATLTEFLAANIELFLDAGKTTQVPRPASPLRTMCRESRTGVLLRPCNTRSTIRHSCNRTMKVVVFEVDD